MKICRLSSYEFRFNNLTVSGGGHKSFLIIISQIIVIIQIIMVVI